MDDETLLRPSARVGRRCALLLLLFLLAAPRLPAQSPPAAAPAALAAPAKEPPSSRVVLSRSDLDALKTEESRRPFSPGELGFETPRISALKMVRLTLACNPQVAMQGETVKGREGALQIEKGVFDTRITGRLGPRYGGNDRVIHYREAQQSGVPVTSYPNPLRGRQGVLDYEFGVEKMLANGVVVSPAIGFTQTFDRDYGNTFSDDVRGNIGFSVTIPLGKGAGTVVNKAPEIAARYDLEASVLQLRFITSQSVADTLRAYWACKAAEAICHLRQESEEIATRLLRSGISMVEADELAPAQLLQIIADRNASVASRIQAETELIAARQELAVAVGVSTSSLLLAPLPGDDFPLPPGGEAIPGEKALIAVTLQMRDDLRAARQTVESRKVLLDASYLNLRPTVNLELLAAYTPFETRDQTFVTRGSEWQAGAALRLDWPIANNTAMGAYIQSQASLHGSRITLEEMERSAISQVITSLAQLKGAAVNMKLYGDAARWYKEALIAQEELFALGHGTLTDTITARQRLVEAQVNYVVARQNYATALVFLRFTTGTLLFSDEQGSWIDPDTWKIVPFQASTSPAKGKGKRSAR